MGCARDVLDALAVEPCSCRRYRYGDILGLCVPGLWGLLQKPWCVCVSGTQVAHVSRIPVTFAFVIVSETGSAWGEVHQLIYEALCPVSRWHRLTYCKVLVGPVWYVTLIKNCLVAAWPHHGCLRILRFKVGISVCKKAQSETVLVLLLDIGRRHADGAVARVVVRGSQVSPGW